jgi:hypothetical protein
MLVAFLFTCQAQQAPQCKAVQHTAHQLDDAPLQKQASSPQQMQRGVLLGQ